MPGSLYSQGSNIVTVDKAAARRTSIFLDRGVICGFVAAVLWLISFCSPYWLQSWEDTRSPFLNMGLWEFCFYRFRHPWVLHDRMFTGCYAIWGNEYRDLREWMLKWWLILIQLIGVLVFIITFISQMIDVCLFLRWPLERILRFEYQLVLATFVMKALCAISLFLCVALFGGLCWDRGWLLYPNYNYVSWGYAFAVFAMIAHGVAAYFMYFEKVQAKERRDKNLNLVMQMYPDGGFNGSLSNYAGSQFI